MVPGYVIIAKGVRRVMPHGERPRVNALQPQHHHFRAALEAALFVVCNIQVVLQTVSLSRKTQIKGQALKRPGRAIALGQRGWCAPLYGRGGGKMEVFHLPDVGVLLEKLVIMSVNVCLQLIPDQDLWTTMQ
jgi:hypothetical protein